MVPELGSRSSCCWRRRRYAVPRLHTAAPTAARAVTVKAGDAASATARTASATSMARLGRVPAPSPAFAALLWSG